MFHLRSSFRQILISKDRDLYGVSRKQLQNPEPRLQAGIASLAKQMESDNEKCKKTITKLHKAAQPYLDGPDQQLVINSVISYYGKCMSLLQREFKELEKYYKKAVTHSE
jgi:hypothetical protein